ncbi:hypothetical protein DFH09DRAFT_1303189 [Mycena vulgaris]|nr:hypothetical protein DFH09DRAFT_1303189 [Mycena vulgaris]
MRRLGVSDLRIPRASPLFTAVQGPAVWRLTLDDSPDTFDFPRPPCEECSGSGTHSVPNLARCKSIKLSTITKRTVSPAPLTAESAARTESQVDDIWEDANFYTAHVGTFITLAAPLPSSFPASCSSGHTSTSRSRRDRAISIPAPPPPPPPITSLPPLLSFLPPPSPPPRLAASLPPLFSPGPFSARSSPPSPSPSPSFSSPSSSSSAHRLAALLSPPPVRQLTAEPRGPPSDVDDEWEECEYEYPYDNVPLSPFVAPTPASSPSPSSPSSLPLPIDDSAKCSQVEYAAADADTASPERAREARAPLALVLFTLSSEHFAHAHAQAPRSPRAFAFARRYFPSASPASPAVKPAAYPLRAVRVGGTKKGKGMRLTAAAVRVPRPRHRDSFHLQFQFQFQLQLASICFYPQLVCFASYPCPPSAASPPSAALYAAYTTQRSPRRRASTASSSTRSSSHSSSSAWHSG